MAWPVVRWHCRLTDNNDPRYYPARGSELCKQSDAPVVSAAAH